MPHYGQAESECCMIICDLSQPAINPEEHQRLLAKIPMGRLASPDDIARGVRMLSSKDAAYITGSALVVDGGLLAQG